MCSMRSSNKPDSSRIRPSRAAGEFASCMAPGPFYYGFQLSAKAFLATGFENRTIARCISLRLYRDPCDFIDNVVDALTKRANANDVSRN